MYALHEAMYALRQSMCPLHWAKCPLRQSMCALHWAKCPLCAYYSVFDFYICLGHLPN